MAESRKGFLSDPLVLAELQALWTFYDKDGDNALNKDEISLLLERLRKREGVESELSPEFVDSVFAFLDVNASGSVEWDEYIAKFNDFWVKKNEWFHDYQATRQKKVLPRSSSLRPRGSAVLHTTTLPSASRSVSMMAPEMSRLPKQLRQKVSFNGEVETGSRFHCPNCKMPIEDAVLKEYFDQAQGRIAPKSQVAEWDENVLKVGKVGGHVPISFLSSPYNIHKWASGASYDVPFLID